MYVTLWFLWLLTPQVYTSESYRWEGFLSVTPGSSLGFGKH